MAQISQLYARLAYDTSTQKSLFTGTFTGISSIELTLDSSATGTANFTIFENNVERPMGSDLTFDIKQSI